MLENSQRYYLDNNATTPCDPRVFALFQGLTLDPEIGNPHSSEHSWGWKAENVISESSEIIASRYNALPDEVIYTSGATEANNMAIMGLAQTNQIEGLGKKKIIVSAIEHKCVLNAAHHASKLFGLELVLCPVNKYGIVDLDFLKDNINQDTLLVSVMAVNNEVGTEQPINAIGKLTRERGTIFHVDAAQAAYFNIDMIEDNIDLISISGHKIYAPKGVGALIASEDLPIKITPIMHGGGQQKGLRSGTLSPALSRALAEAIHILIEEGDAEKARLIDQREKLTQSLKDSGVGFLINGSMRHRHPGNLSIQIPGLETSILINNIQPHLALSTGSACNSGTIETSYVLQAMGLSQGEARGSFRLCLGRFNLNDEINNYTSLIKGNIDKVKKLAA